MTKSGFEPILNFDFKDYLILDIIRLKKGEVGTGALAKLIGLSKKSAIYRIGNLYDLSFLDKETAPLHPQGWRRVWKTNRKGIRMMDLWKDYILGQRKMIEEFRE